MAYVIKLEGLAVGRPSEYDGEYLSFYDPGAGEPGECRLDTVSDADNFGKLVLDALQGRAYVNDSQVDQVDVTMVRCSPEPRTEIELWSLS
jgi:hypothetical protein